MNNIMHMINYRSRKIFIAIMVVLIAVLFFSNYDGDIDSYNTTILALNYSYGFTSRGFVGTLFLLTSKIFPFDINNVVGAKVFLLIFTIIFFCVIIYFIWMLVKRCSDDGVKNLEIMLLYLLIVLVSTYSSGWNFGRVDIFMIMISLLCTCLLIKEKFEWLIILLTSIAVLIHQGYVLMYLNIVLAILAIKILSSREKRYKYVIIFVSSVVICSGLLIYLEIFSHANVSQNVFFEVANNASNLSEDGKYHETLLAHELLGVDLSDVEHSFHMKNLCEIILYVILLMPYIVIFFFTMAKVVSGAKDKVCKLKYTIVYMGALTMLPDYLIKVDYGRWIVATITYYLVVFSYLYLQDNYIRETLNKMVEKVKTYGYVWIILLIYPILFVPYRDVNIDKITALIGHVLNREFLSWW